MGPAWTVLLFIVAAVVVALAGARLAAVADRFADRTGLGEAFTGAVFLGATTSLPGITASVTAAWQGHPQLAISNAVGGIAAQTAFLAVADLFYRQINLEHAAASLPNLISGVLVVILLCGVLLAANSPAVAIFGIHPATLLLGLGYLFGLHLLRLSNVRPQWMPLMTEYTRPDVPDQDSQSSASSGSLLG